MTGYFIQYRNETLKKTLKEYSYCKSGEGTLQRARHYARTLWLSGKPVWRVVKIKQFKDGKLKMVSVHKFLENRS